MMPCWMKFGFLLKQISQNEIWPTRTVVMAPVIPADREAYRGWREFLLVVRGALRLTLCKRGPFTNTGRLKRSWCCRGFTCDYAGWMAAVALPGPEPAGARGLLHTSAPCERVSTSCNRKCDHRGHPATDAEHEKSALGVEMSCEQLGSTTEHLRGDIDSLSMLLKARGSFGLCWLFCVCVRVFFAGVCSHSF